MEKKKIAIITPTYNEELNVEQLVENVKEIMSRFSYEYIHLFIDNDSKDSTPELVKNIIKKNQNVALIRNARNFGHIRSPYYALISVEADAAIILAADFEDPPSLIANLISKWEEGYDVVCAVKTSSEEGVIIRNLRRFYYSVIQWISDFEIIKNYSGFAIYDRRVLSALKNLNEPCPYLRGIISDLGFRIATVGYRKPKRTKGKSKNDVFALFDMALLGLISHSRKPIRYITIFGACGALMSLLMFFGVIIFAALSGFKNTQLWPLISTGIGFFLFLQLLALGIVSEYIGNIYLRVENRPLVIERERINI